MKNSHKNPYRMFCNSIQFINIVAFHSLTCTTHTISRAPLTQSHIHHTHNLMCTTHTIQNLFHNIHMSIYTIEHLYILLTVRTINIGHMLRYWNKMSLKTETNTRLYCILKLTIQKNQKLGLQRTVKTFKHVYGLKK